ncbi:V-type immunoglobulin domain-containing suppressor of T-cell activation [Rhinoraja longicauda]
MDVQNRITCELQALTVLLLLGTVTKGQATELKVSIDHTVYSCPEGLNVTFKCSLSGHLMYRHDHLAKLWYFSHGRNDTCAEKIHIRNISFKRNSHNPYKDRGVYMNSDHRGKFWVTLTNLVHDDQGIYCCVVHELHSVLESKPHARIALTVQGTMELKIVRANGTQASNRKCTVHDVKGESDSEATTAIALATTGCVITILSLPLILLLIYKQRQEAVTRRSHELVRMDSEIVGVENPVFEEISTHNSEVKPRPPPISGRILSESDRHLLSEPNTPASPEAAQRFFPVLELVPDSPM